MRNILTVTIGTRPGDDGVWLVAATEDTTFEWGGDRISLHLQSTLPDPLDENSPVTIRWLTRPGELLSIGPSPREFYQQLDQQKAWLEQHPHVPEAEGLLSFLDHLQDQAVQQGMPEEVVWPRLNKITKENP